MVFPCVSMFVGERLLKLCALVYTCTRRHSQCHGRQYGPTRPQAALDLHRRKLLTFAQSPEAPIVHSDSAAALASTPPVPPLFPFESLKQASGLGWRAPLVNWAWSTTGASRLPSRFKCGRVFAELDARGLESCDEYMSGTPCSFLIQILGPSFLSQFSNSSFLHPALAFIL